MTTHAIQVFIAPDSGMSDAEIQAAADDWVSKRQKWSSDWNTEVVRNRTGVSDTGEAYIQLSIRFDWSEAKDNLMQKLTDKFKTKVGWFVALYHVCYADEENPQDCEWEERWVWDPNSLMPTVVDASIPDANNTVNIE